MNRQVTEAVHISNGGENKRRREVRLLNSKQEFGANVLLEVVVMRGDQVLGQRNQKRRRGRDPILEEEKEGGQLIANLDPMEEDAGLTPQEGEIAPPLAKRVRRTFEEMTREELVEEFKKRRIKPGKRRREAMVDLLNEEDRNQRRIGWAKQARKDAGPKTELREEEEFLC